MSEAKPIELYTLDCEDVSVGISRSVIAFMMKDQEISTLWSKLTRDAQTRLVLECKKIVVDEIEQGRLS